MKGPSYPCKTKLTMPGATLVAAFTDLAWAKVCFRPIAMFRNRPYSNTDRGTRSRAAVMMWP